MVSKVDISVKISERFKPHLTRTFLGRKINIPLVGIFGKKVEAIKKISYENLSEKMDDLLWKASLEKEFEAYRRPPPSNPFFNTDIVIIPSKQSYLPPINGVSKGELKDIVAMYNSFLSTKGFVVIDNRFPSFEKSIKESIKKILTRRNGIDLIRVLLSLKTLGAEFSHIFITPKQTKKSDLLTSASNFRYIRIDPFKPSVIVESLPNGEKGLRIQPPEIALANKLIHCIKKIFHVHQGICNRDCAQNFVIRGFQVTDNQKIVYQLWCNERNLSSEFSTSLTPYYPRAIHEKVDPNIKNNEKDFVIFVIKEKIYNEFLKEGRSGFFLMQTNDLLCNKIFLSLVHQAQIKMWETLTPEDELALGQFKMTVIKLLRDEINNTMKDVKTFYNGFMIMLQKGLRLASNKEMENVMVKIASHAIPARKVNVDFLNLIEALIDTHFHTLDMSPILRNCLVIFTEKKLFEENDPIEKLWNSKIQALNLS